MGQADAILCSPPYADSVNGGHHGIDPGKGKQAADRPRSVGRQRIRLADYTTYGTTPGQLGALRAGPCPGGEGAAVGQADAILTSPPYADVHETRGAAAESRRRRDRRHRAAIGRDPDGPGSLPRDQYGEAEGQVGALRAGPCPGGEAEVGDVETLTWAGIYSQGWGRGLLSPGAFSHPAKFAYGLLTRLYDHGFGRGWWQKHSLICDPFGGVGCGGVVAAYRGLRWVGCELEPRFVALAEETFALHRGKWAAAGDTPPVIVQGDSRQFAALVAGAAGVITSPPWADAGMGDGRFGGGLTAYGTTPGQLGGLPQGGADAVLTSPPYAGVQETRAPEAAEARRERDRRHCLGRGSRGGDPDGPGNLPQGTYGATPGQVGNLAAGDAGAVVTSPGYGGSEISDNRKTVNRTIAGLGRKDGKRRGNSIAATIGAYADEANVSARSGETYWDAVRCIYGQCLLALRPGGVACVVVKDFVRAKKRVPLCDQTWRLLLSLGFLPVERIRCLLAEETREPSLFGGVEVKKRSRQSFFRRLATKKGAPDIPYEEILVVRRPPGAGEGPADG